MVKILKGVCLILFAAIVFAGCGGGEKPADDETPGITAPEQETSKEMSPAELGQQIGDIYIKALQNVTEMLKDKPAVEEIQAEVEALREKTILALVELGKKRESMEASDKSVVDSQIRMKISPAYNADWYSTYNDVQMHYFQDREFHKLVMDFNIIGQYANFDLLKKQAPEEATRLGIIE